MNKFCPDNNNSTFETADELHIAREKTNFLKLLSGMDRAKKICLQKE